ncbi:MAG: cytochrome c-type biogenesis protein CcmH [Anaerolineae bacterium]
MKLWLVLLGLLLALTWLAGAVSAQSPVSDDQVNAIAKKLYCPVCENTPLDVCPTQACKDWRALIRQQLSQGWTEAQILDYFAANYGPGVLAQPPARGFTSLVWLLPVLGLAGGGLILWRLLRGWQARRLPPAAGVAEARLGPAGVSPELLDRIEREIEARF